MCVCVCVCVCVLCGLVQCGMVCLCMSWCTPSVGEGYVMTLFSVLTFVQQGTYRSRNALLMLPIISRALPNIGIFDVISNLGSIVARFVFKPVEESFYIFFAHSLYRGLPASEQKKESLLLATKTLAILLKFVVCTSLIILTFGFSYSHLALTIYGGQHLVNNGGHTLMRWFCLYVVMLAVNGITECFFFAVMSEEDVERSVSVTCLVKRLETSLMSFFDQI